MWIRGLLPCQRGTRPQTTHSLAGRKMVLSFCLQISLAGPPIGWTRDRSRPVMASFWVTNIHFHISDLYVDIIKVNDIRFLLLLRVLLPEVNAKGLRRWLSQTTRLILSNHCWIAQNHLLSTVLNCRESFQYIRGNIKILKGKDSFTWIDFKSTTASRTLMPQRLGHIILRTK